VSDPRAGEPRAWVLALSLALSLALGASALGAPAAPSAPEAEARAAAQETIDRVLGVLRNPSLSQEEKRSQVEQIAYQRFDFELISRLVLAQNWSKLNPEQQAEFVDAFKKHLSASYRDTLDNYRDEKITIDGSRPEAGGDVTVMTVVHGSTDDTHVAYRLRKVGGDWRGIDVIVEGVSLVQNFRSQTQEILSAQSPDVLIQRLRDKQVRDVAPKGKRSS
jgi:phospholipid transport system substrate-binding protein